MIVKVLAENTSVSDDLDFEHGLSLYIETENHKILFDTGKSGLFAENARKMGVDLGGADLAVISHGHYDHGGGLGILLGANGTAKVYLHRRAFEGHYAARKDGSMADIGLDTALLPNGRFVFCGDGCEIDAGLRLFSGVRGEALMPSGNASLFMGDGGGFVPDDFAHEQNLAITEGDATLLVAGCAHSGIVNILRHFIRGHGAPPDVVVGGFHLFNPNSGESEKLELVREIADFLLDTGAQYYTCHCTGRESYEALKAVMGGRIGYLSTGEALVIDGGGSRKQ